MVFGRPSSIQRWQISLTTSFQSGGGFFARELTAADFVASAPQGDDFAFQMSRSKALRHVFGQRTPVETHVLKRHGSAVASVRRRGEEVESAAAVPPERHHFRQSIRRGVMRLVDEKSLAAQVGGQLLRVQTVQRGMGTSERVVAWTGLAEVSDQPLGRTELLAVPRSQNEIVGNFNVRRGRSLTFGKAYVPIIEVGEALFDLLLRGRNDRMAEARDRVALPLASRPAWSCPIP